MYRTRVTVQILYGHFKEHLETCHRLNELARSRGWDLADYLNGFPARRRREELSDGLPTLLTVTDDVRLVLAVA